MPHRRTQAPPKAALAQSDRNACAAAEWKRCGRAGTTLYGALRAYLDDQETSVPRPYAPALLRELGGRDDAGWPAPCCAIRIQEREGDEGPDRDELYDPEYHLM